MNGGLEDWVVLPVVVVVVWKVVPVVVVWIVVPVHIVVSAAVCVIGEIAIISGGIPVLTNWALVFKC